MISRGYTQWSIGSVLSLIVVVFSSLEMEIRWGAPSTVVTNVVLFFWANNGQIALIHIVEFHGSRRIALSI